jgi:hypothetical protein
VDIAEEEEEEKGGHASAGHNVAGSTAQPVADARVNGAEGDERQGRVVEEEEEEEEEDVRQEKVEDVKPSGWGWGGWFSAATSVVRRVTCDV